VKSFEHPTDKIEERCTKILDMISHFDDRHIRSNSDWVTTLYPALREFLFDAAQGVERLRLVLDAHTTLAFAAGSVLNIKSGRVVELEQRTIGRHVWVADDATPDPSWATWTFEEVVLSADRVDIAVAVGLTHDTAAVVQTYVQRALPQVGTLLIARLLGGAGARSVVCGRHAFDLAESLTGRVKAIRDTVSAPIRTHLFLAGPNAFTFFLGQRQVAIGNVALYEFDLEGGRDSSYQRSLELPVTVLS
jgi:hypothetical protein